MGRIEYYSNGEAGHWWLSDADWRALEDAGWAVDWYADMPGRIADEDGRWLGALASRATKATDDAGSSIAEWERITGQSSTAEGCSCCGERHDFVYEDSDGVRHHGVSSAQQP